MTTRIHESLRGLSWMPFSEARTYVSSLGLKNQADWINYDKSNFPNDLPKNPASHYDEFYPSGGWGYFLGTGTISNKWKHENYLDYNKAKEFVQSLRLNGYVEWDLYINGELKREPALPKLPDNIPRYPNDIYPEFEGWVEFTGAGRYDAKYGYSYNDAKKSFTH